MTELIVQRLKVGSWNCPLIAILLDHRHSFKTMALARSQSQNEAELLYSFSPLSKILAIFVLIEILWLVQLLQTGASYLG